MRLHLSEGQLTPDWVQELVESGAALVCGQDSPVPNVRSSIQLLTLENNWVATCAVNAGLLTDIEKFSKHIHGTATLFPDMVQVLPYWVDDESVRASMLISAPEQPEMAPT